MTPDQGALLLQTVMTAQWHGSWKSGCRFATPGVPVSRAHYVVGGTWPESCHFTGFHALTHSLRHGAWRSGAPLLTPGTDILWPITTSRRGPGGIVPSMRPGVRTNWQFQIPFNEFQPSSIL